MERRKPELPGRSASAQNYNSHATSCNACLSLVRAHTLATLTFHRSHLAFMQRCSSLVTAHTHTTLAFYWPRLTPTQYLFTESFCKFYLQLDVSVPKIHRVHRISWWYIILSNRTKKENKCIEISINKLESMHMASIEHGYKKKTLR